MIHGGSSGAEGTVNTAGPTGQGAGGGIHRSFRFNSLLFSRVASIYTGRFLQSAFNGLSTRNRRLSRKGIIPFNEAEEACKA